MSKINVDANEYADLVVAFLFDKILHSEEILSENERFNDVMEFMSRKGMKPILFKAYRDMDSQTRIKYKKIKNIFDYTATTAAIINIMVTEKEEKETKKDKESIVKKIIKKIIAGDEISTEDKEYLKEMLEDK